MSIQKAENGHVRDSKCATQGRLIESARLNPISIKLQLLMYFLERNLSAPMYKCVQYILEISPKDVKEYCNILHL